MTHLMRQWGARLLASALIGLLLTACARGLEAQPAAGAPALGFLTINVELTDAGIQPASISVPAGREVKLIVRNRSMNEHHYHVLGLVPDDVWRVVSDSGDDSSAADGAASAVMTEADHAHHHDASLGGYLPQLGEVDPNAKEVHAYVQGGGGGMDVIFFTATAVGTYAIHCPLHPDTDATLTVFAP